MDLSFINKGLINHKINKNKTKEIVKLKKFSN